MNIHYIFMLHKDTQVAEQACHFSILNKNAEQPLLNRWVSSGLIFWGEFLLGIRVFNFFQQSLYFDHVTTVIGGEREKNYWISHNSNPPFTIFCFNHQRFFDILLINVENNWIAQKIHIYHTKLSLKYTCNQSLRTFFQSSQNQLHK